MENLLSYWLFFIGIFKLVSALLITNIKILKSQVNEDKIKFVNPLFSRSLIIWFSYTSIVNFLTSYNLDNKLLVISTLFSFLVGLPYLISEFFIHKTYKRFHATHFLTICIGSSLWLIYHLYENF